ncbi:hypothetical protein KAU39_02540, partial [bacterium]|nr:hypothetical protein [bacterium]
FETTEALVKQLKDDSAKTSKELESIETTYKNLKKKKNTLEATIRQLSTLPKPKEEKKAGH